MNKKAQVWIETVIYTLVALAMIGMIMMFARPKIEEMQDRSILQQSTDMLKEIDSTILSMGTTGNQRVLELGIKKGILRIDGVHEKLVFELETKMEYSEPGKEVKDGSIVIVTTTKTANNLVTLTRDYSLSYNIEFEGENVIKELSKGSTAYKILISNEGGDEIERTVLNMSLI